MNQLMYVAIGGALGAMARFGLMNGLQASFGVRVFTGTLAVNVIGSFLIGLMYVIIAERMHISAEWRYVIMVGFLGGFTTFSTFSLDAFVLFDNGQTGVALAYVLASLLLCLGACWAAITIARLF